ncbi:hypothetical protein THIOM_001228 [Candidatus Thiomargarita nelsonii]|uniref:Uncharacterized protein n=1 Tax=Candidatus Thiomargarita nelsonii TaxID=1003181 RepID=A0A176S4Z6_9GAMM|nr:hypothetical protein THIOM_001228 [Candidatus Thiomargarita nelsonii]
MSRHIDSLCVITQFLKFHKAQTFLKNFSVRYQNNINNFSKCFRNHSKLLKLLILNTGTN